MKLNSAFAQALLGIIALICFVGFVIVLSVDLQGFPANAGVVSEKFLSHLLSNHEPSFVLLLSGIWQSLSFTFLVVFLIAAIGASFYQTTPDTGRKVIFLAIIGFSLYFPIKSIWLQKRVPHSVYAQVEGRYNSQKIREIETKGHLNYGRLGTCNELISFSGRISITKATCLSITAKVKKDPGICALIETKPERPHKRAFLLTNIKDLCYMDLATKLQQPELCQKTTQPDACLKNYQTS